MLGRRIVDGKPRGFSQRGTSLALSLRVHERDEAALLLLPGISKKTTHVSANEYQGDLRQTFPGIQSVQTFDLNPFM